MTPIRSAGNAQFKALHKLVQSSRERQARRACRCSTARISWPPICDHVGSRRSDRRQRLGLRQSRNQGSARAHVRVEPIVLARCAVSETFFGRHADRNHRGGRDAARRAAATRSSKLASWWKTCRTRATWDRSCDRPRRREWRTCCCRRTRCTPGRRACCAPAMGAHFLLRIHEGVDLAAAVREFKGRVIATSQQAQQSLFETDLRGKRGARVRKRRRRDLSAGSSTARACTSSPSRCRARPNRSTSRRRRRCVSLSECDNCSGQHFVITGPPLNDQSN